MSILKKLFRLLFILTAWLLSLLIVLLALLAFVHIPIDISAQKKIVETALTKALDREVTVKGKIIVSTSLSPSFSIQDVHIGNPEDFDKDEFIVLQSAQFQVDLLPLLQSRIHLQEIRGKGIHVTLLENEAGRNNWSTSTPEKTAEPPEKKERQRISDRFELAPDTLVIDRISFEDISLSFKSAVMQDTFQFTIRQCNGAVQPGNPTSLDMDGTWQTHSFTTDIQIGSLQEFLKHDRSWIEINTEIAETRLHLAGTINLVTVLESLDLKAGIYGARLDTLNELFHMELPPLQSYEAEADLTLRQKLLTLNKLKLKAGDSLLEGNMVIDAKGERPEVNIFLTAPLIQINDFDFGNGTAENVPVEEPEENSAEEKKEERIEQEAAPGQDDPSRFARFFSQDFFKQFDASVTVNLENVVSGDDSLGSGELKASLLKGRLAIEPLQLGLPSGSMFLTASFEPGETEANAALRISAENFDFGIAARRANPDTDMGGTLDLDVDLRSSGGSLDEILANGSGYIDFSARPINLNSGIMDLWVVNLLAAIISRGDKEGSPINCLISRWSMEDGVLTPNAFAVDTGIMRICGSGQINMKEGTLDIRVAPTPKRRRFFSLATPFSISGSIKDIKMGIASGGVLGTSVRFVASPVTTPLSWLLAQKIPQDGSDICDMEIGPGNRPEERLPGCRSN